MKLYRPLFFILGSVLVSYGSENYLSQTKKDILNYSYKKSLEDSKKLKNDWINPIIYKYIYNEGEEYTTKKSFLSISQPIFKSGGIYYAIKYASSFKNYSTANIDIEKKELIKKVINLLFQLKKIDISIKKQALLVKNGNLDIKRKKEQVLNGLLDTSFLDNAIIDTNNKQNILIDSKYQKQLLINNLAVLSDKEYTKMELPTLSLSDDKSFLENNIYIKSLKEEISQSNWMRKMVSSKYLPSVNFTLDYTKYHDTDNNPSLRTNGVKNVGFNLTIPFDIKYSNETSSYKIAYLQKKAQLEDKKKEELSIFKSSIAKIKALDKKIVISKKDVKLYDSLVTQLQEQLEVGMKVISDLEIMENSKKIKILEIKALEVDKQIELLEIYSRTQVQDG